MKIGKKKDDLELEIRVGKANANGSFESKIDYVEYKQWMEILNKTQSCRVEQIEKIQQIFFGNIQYRQKNKEKGAFLEKTCLSSHDFCLVDQNKDFRISLKREKWSDLIFGEPTLFRNQIRQSFYFPEFRIDLSEVVQATRQENLHKTSSHYEMEFEILHNKENYHSTMRTIFKNILQLYFSKSLS